VAGALTQRAIDLREKMGLPRTEPLGEKELGLLIGDE
jgi:hypothetical protein